MISSFLRWFLPFYFMAFLFVALILRTLLVARQIGKSPLIFPRTDTVYGLTGFYFKAALAVLFALMIGLGIVPQWYDFMFPLHQLEHSSMQQVGIGIMLLAFVLVSVAQAQMRDSWRIGIDTRTKTNLVTRGLFQYSRNPIYLGILLCLLGLIFVLPCAFTLFLFILVYVLLQIQIRLEEEHMYNLHNETFRAYQKQVRRWI